MTEDIIIKKVKGGCFDVHVGDYSTGWVTFDEMLGVVTQLTMPEERHCLQWLKTKEQHEAFKNRYKPVNLIFDLSKGTIRTALSEPKYKEDKI